MAESLLVGCLDSDRWLSGDVSGFIDVSWLIGILVARRGVVWGGLKLAGLAPLEFLLSLFFSLSFLLTLVEAMIRASTHAVSVRS
jgi:hypothetical protein